MPLILKDGYEDVIRTKLGVKKSELPDEDINQPLILGLAETITTKRVPDYQSITDPADLLFLEGAVVSYICYLLCPSMYRRLNYDVSTLDVKWKKDKVDWDEMALKFLGDYEGFLGQIESVEVVSSGDSTLMGIIKASRSWDVNAG